MHDLLSHLNDEQRKAVTAPLGPVLVLAGAGSGKTRVLTYRIAHLIGEKKFSPENILALTFTNKAAGEMKGRIRKLLTRPTATLSSQRRGAGGEEGLTMGTFHSVCARILRREIEHLKLGYTRNFVIYDSDDQLKLVKQIVIELGLERQFKPQLFAYYISAAKNRLTSPASLRLDNSYLEQSLSEVYEHYQKGLREHNALDFDDLLMLVCELWKKNKRILEQYRNKFQYILVDEYQDTNHAQYMMLKLLAKKNNIFVVGDDAQSIYGFRGANMQNILNFKKDYPQARIYMLEQNYRSTQGILDVAHKVIKLNPFQYEKKLWTENKTGSKVSLYEAIDEMDEAQFVLQTIGNNAPQPPLTVRGGEGELSYTPILDSFVKTKPRQVYSPQILNLKSEILNQTVILYRTHAQSRSFEDVLIRNSVPYQIIGGIKFYERKEIKDTLAYLRIISNSRDLVSLSRVINTPARGIGPANLRTLVLGLKKYKFSFTRLSLNLDALELQDKARAGAKEFLELMAAASSLPKENNILELMHLLLTRSGYKEQLLKDGEEGLERWENIEELFNVAAKYSAQGGSASGRKNLAWREALQLFLEEISLMTDLDSMDDQSQKLTLMTLHSAKGLEFENVFFVGLEEGLLPHSRSLLNPGEIAEEIRLAYVGITRARKNLYLSYARQRQHYGEIKRCVPSRIIKAIPKNLLRKIGYETTK